jgi:hypothetical protein
MPNRDGLNRFFTKGVAAASIAESLVSFDEGTALGEADQVDVREGGTVVGHERTAALGNGRCRQDMEPFRDGQVVSDTTPLGTVLEALNEHEAVFVSVLGAMGIPSRAVGRRRIKEFESLRNNLAHSQDIVAKNWDVIARLRSSVENILARLDVLPAPIPENLQRHPEGVPLSCPEEEHAVAHSSGVETFT